MSLKINEFRGRFVERITNQSVMLASLWLFLYTSLPAAVIGASITIATQYFTPAVMETVGPGVGQRNLGLTPALIFNPLIESFILTSLIVIGVKLKLGRLSIIVSALVLGALHSLQHPVWGSTVLSFFLIQAYAIFHMFKSGFMRSCWVASVSHAMHNAWLLAALFCLARLH